MAFDGSGFFFSGGGASFSVSMALKSSMSSFSGNSGGVGGGEACSTISATVSLDIIPYSAVCFDYLIDGDSLINSSGGHLCTSSSGSVAKLFNLFLRLD